MVLQNPRSFKYVPFPQFESEYWFDMQFVNVSNRIILCLFSFCRLFLALVVTCPGLVPSQNSVQLTNATNTDGSFDYLSNVIYSCNRGYETSHPTQLQCQSNGTWTNSVPVCKSKSIVTYCFQMTSKKFNFHSADVNIQSVIFTSGSVTGGGGGGVNWAIQ